MGRPPLDFAETKVADLIDRGASNREIADILGYDHVMVANRISPLLKKKRAERRLRIREAQCKLAMEGNPKLLIWLGKQLLGQSELKAGARGEQGSKRRTLDDIPDDEPDVETRLDLAGAGIQDESGSV
jgi:hypothetical protein